MRKSYQILHRSKKYLASKKENRARRSRRKRKLRAFRLKINGRPLTVTLVCPVALSIRGRKSRKALLTLSSDIKRYVNRRPVLLDFRNTKRLDPTGVLYLTAELDRLRRHGGTAYSVEMLRPKDEIADQVLQQVGLAQLCGEPVPKSTDHFDESVKHWRYATGERMNDAPGRAFERLEGRLSDELQDGMWKGVSEAIVNSVAHAYLEPRNDGFPCNDGVRWWMFSQVRDGTLTVAVCDLGIGIPRSLPIKWEAGPLSQILAKFGMYKPEVAAIRAALEIGATRTGEENRGRGLPQVWEDMKGHSGSNIMILSNKAMLFWRSDLKKETNREFNESIFGTMIIWSVPINQKDLSDGTENN